MVPRAALFREAGDFRGSDVARRARRCQPKSGFSSFFLDVLAALERVTGGALMRFYEYRAAVLR